jgi:hypothetical protein
MWPSRTNHASCLDRETQATAAAEHGSGEGAAERADGLGGAGVLVFVAGAATAGALVFGAEVLGDGAGVLIFGFGEAEEGEGAGADAASGFTAATAPVCAAVAHPPTAPATARVAPPTIAARAIENIWFPPVRNG